METIRINSAAQRTRTKIIRAAEKLFAEKGFRAMTLRDVTKEARVNLAAVNYHFGSKANLVSAVVESRFQPINSERLRRLDQCISTHHPNPVPLSEIFASLFDPLFEQLNRGTGTDRRLGRLIGRALSEPADFIRGIHRDFFTEICERFSAELHRSCPELSEVEVATRFQLTVSTMLGTITEPTRFEDIFSGTDEQWSTDALRNAITQFAIAGFKQN